MAGWADQIERKATIIKDQMMAAARLDAKYGTPEDLAAEPYARMLAELYRDEMPMARMLDTSDIILHAEGPILATDHPGLRAFNWLTTTADRQLRQLAISVSSMMREDSSAMVKKLDFRLTGIANGSLYAGFCLTVPETPLFDQDETLLDQIRLAIYAVAQIPSFVEDEEMAQEIFHAIDDPALRDAAMRSAYYMAPTGKLGVHTVEISTPATGSHGSLGQRERIVLKAAIQNPVKTRQSGSFVGEVRVADLDKKLFHLRTQDFTIRCVAPELTADMARHALGRQMRVQGMYETDRSGRPRLMQVEHIQPITVPVNSTLDL